MEAYLKPEEDGLPMRKSGKWVSAKLDYLERYLAIFGKSMRDKPWRARHYIDLFAGPGKCLVQETNAIHLGSTLLALTTPYPFTGYFFVDLEARNVAALKERCSASRHHSQTRFHTGDSNIAVRQIVDQIVAVDRQYLPGKWSSLNLAFLDPEGLELHWSTVACLASVGRMDLIINYPQGGLNRFMPKAIKQDGETVVDTFFGSRDWRSIYAEYLVSRGSGLHGQLIDLYKGKLLALGYVEVRRDDEVGDEPLIRNSQRNAPLYRLLFASKHELGEKFWQDVTRRDVHGQRRLFDA